MLFEYLSDTERTKIKPLNYRKKNQDGKKICLKSTIKNHFCLGISFDLTYLPCFVARLTRKAVHALVARVTLHITRQINFDTSKYFDSGQSFLLWELLTLSNLNSRHWQCPPTEPLSLHRNKTEFVFCFGRIVKLTSACFFTATTAKLYLLTAWDCQCENLATVRVGNKDLSVTQWWVEETSFYSQAGRRVYWKATTG